MKNSGSFGSDLARKSGGFICVSGGHLLYFHSMLLFAFIESARLQIQHNENNC